MKGIILAGGKGTRLSPATLTTSKQLLPVWDKPMFYYPLATLISAGISEVLFITNPGDTENFSGHFGDGSRLGMDIKYETQAKPRGIAEAFLIGEKFLVGEGACLILGDNFVHGGGISQMLEESNKKSEGATIFAYQVRDPER